MNRSLQLPRTFDLKSFYSPIRACLCLSGFLLSVGCDGWNNSGATEPQAEPKLLPDATVPALNLPPLEALDKAPTDIRRFLLRLIGEVTSNPADSERRGQLAMALEVNGFRDTALLVYRQAQTLDPTAFSWPYFRAHLRADAGALDEALGLLRYALALEPEYQPAWLWLGQWLLDAGQAAEALDAFKHAQALGPSLASTLMMAQAQLRLGNPAAAIELLESPTISDPHPASRRTLRRAWLQLGNSEQAQKYLLSHQQAEPLTWSDPIAETKQRFIAGLGTHLHVVKELVGRSDFHAALKLLELHSFDAAENVEFLYQTALVYSQLDRVDEAVARLRDATELEPTHYPSFLLLARIQRARGEFAAALTWVERAIDIHPQLSAAYQEQAITFMALRRYEQASRSIDKAIQFDTRDVEVYYYAGILAGMQEQWEEARGYFVQATALDPQHIQAQLHLARVLGELGAIEDASRALTTAEALDPENPEIAEVRLFLRSTPLVKP